MVYESLMEKLLDENNDEVIELQPDGGEVVKFEQIGVVVYEENLYAILHPVQDTLADDQVVVFKLNPDDEESMELVVDEKIAANVLEVYNNDDYEEE